MTGFKHLSILPTAHSFLENVVLNDFAHFRIVLVKCFVFKKEFSKNFSGKCLSAAVASLKLSI